MTPLHRRSVLTGFADAGSNVVLPARTQAEFEQGRAEFESRLSGTTRRIIGEPSRPSCHHVQQTLTMRISLCPVQAPSCRC